MSFIRFEKALWDAMEPEDKVSMAGVLYTPALEYDQAGVDPDDPDDLGTPTGNVVMAHPVVDDADEVLLELTKVRRADAYLANKGG